jgi:hypothetical protein
MVFQGADGTRFGCGTRFPSFECRYLFKPSAIIDDIVDPQCRPVAYRRVALPRPTSLLLTPFVLFLSACGLSFHPGRSCAAPIHHHGRYGDGDGNPSSVVDDARTDAGCRRARHSRIRFKKQRSRRMGKPEWSRVGTGGDDSIRSPSPMGVVVVVVVVAAVVTSMALTTYAKGHRFGSPSEANLMYLR